VSTARSSSLSPRGASLARSRLSQAAKFGAGDSVTKVESFGVSREIYSTTCLIRKLPNDTPERPRWQLEIE
jgi:hypothetical protein